MDGALVTVVAGASCVYAPPRRAGGTGQPRLAPLRHPFFLAVSRFMLTFARHLAPRGQDGSALWLADTPYYIIMVTKKCVPML